MRYGVYYKDNIIGMNGILTWFDTEDEAKNTIEKSRIDFEKDHPNANYFQEHNKTIFHAPDCAAFVIWKRLWLPN